MSEISKDPIGQAILTYAKEGKAKDIVVKSSICEDDVIPVAYLFRKEPNFPEIEKLALSLCKGKILDVGAGSGAHARVLLERGFDVSLIDTSAGAVSYHQSQGFMSRQIDFFELEEKEQFDTLLFLMNGIGIAGSLEQLDRFLLKAKNHLNAGGQILADSTDIKYLYEDEDGSFWTDLNSTYYGNFDFQMCFEGNCGDPFDWLYVDFNTLCAHAKKCGLKCELLFEEENQYLARMTKM